MKLHRTASPDEMVKEYHARRKRYRGMGLRTWWIVPAILAVGFAGLLYEGLHDFYDGNSGTGGRTEQPDRWSY